MNTKTMRLPPRRVLTPNGTTTTTSSATTINNSNNKRKEREKEKEGINAATITKIPKTATARAGGRIGLAELVFSSNKILAGYLAHEFLTRGTLFGQQWDPTSTNQNEAVSKKAEEEKPKPSGEAEGQVEEEEGDDQQQRQQEKERYVELANLLKTGGAHLAGIVNPTQLTHFLHKKR